MKTYQIYKRGTNELLATYRTYSRQDAKRFALENFPNVAVSLMFVSTERG